jgi:hypothetical protein
MEIELTGTESRVGDFAVDIFAREVGSGHEVIIENQLAPTDHGHLGQLLTYASGLDAKVIIWISPQFRDEHRQALDWLNRETSESISVFGLELELLRIDDSAPAPNFKIVAQPSEWQKATRVRGEAGEVGVSERQSLYHEFFVGLVEMVHQRLPGFSNVRRVGYDSWLHFATGRSGFAYSVAFVVGGLFRTELEIDLGDRERNRAAFEQLLAQRDQLEASVGSLTWDAKEGRRAFRVYLNRPGTVDESEDTLNSLREWAINNLIQFRDHLSPRIKSLELP